LQESEVGTTGCAVKSPKSTPLSVKTTALSLSIIASALSPMWLPATVLADVVVPGGNASVEGNYNNAFPFNIGSFEIASMRYQQIYGASAFSSLTAPEFITSISFRLSDFNPQAFSATLPSIQIDLSTTSRAVDGLSSTYASNVGSNDTVVFNQGPLSLSSAGGSSPAPFDITIVLQHPFLYDPSQGNLLLDVRNFGGGTSAFFDAQNVSGDATARVYGNGDGVSASTGSVDTAGLITSFGFSSPGPGVTTVPEPVNAAMLSFAALGSGFSLLRRRKAAVSRAQV
jgi:hypothetical protein